MSFKDFMEKNQKVLKDSEKIEEILEKKTQDIKGMDKEKMKSVCLQLMNGIGEYIRDIDLDGTLLGFGESEEERLKKAFMNSIKEYKFEIIETFIEKL